MTGNLKSTCAHGCWEKDDQGVECCVFCGVVSAERDPMKPKDQIRIGPEVSPGQRIAFRRRGEEFAVGTIGELKDGRPIPEGAEFIKLARECHDGWHDATVLYSHESAPNEQQRSGPAQVATPEYREGYDRIFGKQKVGLA